MRLSFSAANGEQIRIFLLCPRRAFVGKKIKTDENDFELKKSWRGLREWYTVRKFSC